MPTIPQTTSILPRSQRRFSSTNLLISVTVGSWILTIYSVILVAHKIRFPSEDSNASLNAWKGVAVVSGIIALGTTIGCLALYRESLRERKISSREEPLLQVGSHELEKDLSDAI